MAATSTAPPERLPPAAASRDNNLNFLRLVLALLVLLAHAPELADGNRSRELLTRVFHTLSFGEVAVDGFFLLSGYLIVQSWERRGSRWDFAQKRLRRIYPAFVVACLVCVFGLAPLAVPSVRAYFAQLEYGQLLSSTLRLEQPEVPLVFAGTPFPLINGAMWSIAYEVRCYVLVALVGLLGPRLHRWGWLGLAVFALVMLPLHQQVNRWEFPFRPQLLKSPEEFFRLLAFFAVGACFYLFRRFIVLRGRWAAGATLLLVALLFLPKFASLGLATAGAYALFWVAFAPIAALDRFKRLPDISYGLYLYGWPMQKLLNWYFPTASVWVLLAATAGLASLAGYASWHLVEAPWLKGKRPRAADGAQVVEAGAR
jgi:peptidoglycan/LPS O-acetylase OafA/YrhL